MAGTKIKRQDRNEDSPPPPPSRAQKAKGGSKKQTTARKEDDDVSATRHRVAFPDRRLPSTRDQDSKKDAGREPRSAMPSLFLDPDGYKNGATHGDEQRGGNARR